MPDCDRRAPSRYHDKVRKPLLGIQVEDSAATPSAGDRNPRLRGSRRPLPRSKVAKKDALLAAEGAVMFLERLSPALEQVDNSSGSIGAAVSNAIFEMVPLGKNAQAGKPMRDAWLERLFEAHQADEIPYIEQLADYWGNLCTSEETASALGRSPDRPNTTAPSFGHWSAQPFSRNVGVSERPFWRQQFDEIIELLSVDAVGLTNNGR